MLGKSGYRTSASAKEIVVLAIFCYCIGKSQNVLSRLSNRDRWGRFILTRRSSPVEARMSRPLSPFDRISALRCYMGFPDYSGVKDSFAFRKKTRESRSPLHDK
jgi:hypothetical protein